MERVRGLGVRFGRERSFRLSRGSLLTDRFLVSLSTTGVAVDRIVGACRQLKMPDSAANAVGTMVRGARFVHLGFERSDGSYLYKVYLESPMTSRPAGPVVLHQAYKWDPRRPEKCVLTKYVWHPDLSIEQVIDRLAMIYHADGTAPSFDITGGILRLAAGRMDGPVRYMEVSEDGNDRRSFDLNLYDAALRIADLLPFLGRMCARYAIPPENFYAFCGPIQQQAFGHLAGGIHRAGEDFFTVYFGVESIA